MKYTFIILLGLLVITSCGRSHKSVGDKTSTIFVNDLSLCNLKGTLEFHPQSSQSKCVVVIILEQGERILPTNATDFQANFNDGQHVRLGIEWLNLDDPLCHNTSAHIQVNCIIPLEEPFIEKPAECEDPIDPYEVAWMNKIIISLKPTKIIKYNFGNDLAFHFIQKNNEAIYTCHGELICSNSNPNIEDCKKWMDEMKNPEVILVVNN